MEMQGMSEHRQREEPEAPAEGVFGNLPRERPGTRSPRRDARAGGGAGMREAETPGPGPHGDEGAARGAEIRGVEDLAWAGVAIAAEAATLGVRLASRAIGAVRGPAERS
jgi:hypothetical protein